MKVSAATPGGPAGAMRGPARGRFKPAEVVAAAGLVTLTLLVFWPVAHHGFVNWDDAGYISGNPVVRQGLTVRGLAWAFTTGTAATWHPLTWISHMADVELFGMNAGAHHLVGLALHLAAVLLLLRFLRLATGRTWRSAAVAALFAVHPLHVEPVAWASARKDVLSGALFMLVLLAYLAYARRPSAGRYSLVALLLALGLLAKPMLVTLPGVLLLLDYWPLDRLGAGAGKGAAQRLLLEKAPLLLLSAAASAVAFLAASRGGAVSGLDVAPVGGRAGNVLAAYVLYLWKTVAPAGLSFVYPHPLRAQPLAATLAAGAFLAAVSFLAVATRRRRPWLLVGWAWYLLVLLPVVGIVPFGVQWIADRFTYLPLVGVFVAAACSVPPMPTRGPWRVAAAVSALALVGLLALRARAQVDTWQDDFSLFGHAIEVDAGNWIAQNNIGLAYVDRGELDEAAAHFEAAARVNPGSAAAWNNLGQAYLRLGRLAEAESGFRQALALEPAYEAPREGLETLRRLRGAPWNPGGAPHP